MAYLSEMARMMIKQRYATVAECILHLSEVEVLEEQKSQVNQRAGRAPQVGPGRSSCLLKAESLRQSASCSQLAQRDSDPSYAQLQNRMKQLEVRVDRLLKTFRSAVVKEDLSPA